MANLPRHPTPHLTRLAALAAALLAVAWSARAEAQPSGGLVSARAAQPARSEAEPSGGIGLELDLLGTWHVLVHYRDSAAQNADAERWDDRVWVFERSGSRLRWTEYPIVVFQDDTGRFERRPGGHYGRVLGSWEPDAGQLADIADGLQVNSRGSKSKTLRGSDAEGWSSTQRAAPASASVITYEQTWTIESPRQPVFVQSDVLASARAESMEGETRYATTEILGGDLLVGTYARDGTRHGTFSMRRSADTQPLEEKTQEELQRQAAQRTIRFGSAARDELRTSFEEDLAEGGVFLEPRELEALVEEATGLLAAGEPRDEIGRRLGDSARSAFLAFAPPDARHDDSTRYGLPFDASVPRRLEIGAGSGSAMTRSGAASGLVGHHGWSKYSFDFSAPPGSAILAARAGRVARVTTAFFERERQEGRTRPATAVFVAHDDGTFAIYGHLGDELQVGTGDRVAAGAPIGPAVGPRSHFGVVRRDGEGRLHSVDIRFADGSAEGFVPVQGSSYGGKSGRAATGSP